MRETEFKEQGSQQRATNPAVKILERMNPLKAPVSPGEQVSELADGCVNVL